MPGRKPQPPRLWLRSRGDGEPTWVILHRGRQISTGCSAEDVGGASRRLADFIADQHQPTLGARHPAAVETADVLTFYVQHKRPTNLHERKVAARYDELIAYTTTLTLFWGDKKLSQVRGQTCREYVAWRTAQTLRKAKTEAALKKRVSTATARRELEMLRAAINLYHAEFTLDAVPKVTLPERSAPRERWLTRTEVARLLAATLGFVWDASTGRWRRDEQGRLVRRDQGTRTRRRHVARFLLIGIYTGTRHDAIERMQWLSNTTGGWFDLDREVMFRRGIRQRETKKRRPPARIAHRLVPHLRRWSQTDSKPDRFREGPTVFVIHKPNGTEISGRIRTSWDGIVTDAGLGPEVVPHVMRHTAATWHMQAGTDLWEAAGTLGMTPEQLQAGYGHHSPDFQEGAAAAFGRLRRAPEKQAATA